MASSSKSYDVSEIEEESTDASINGVVIDISEVKTSRTNKDIKYVEGQFSDGRTSCRFVSFHSEHKKKLDSSKSKCESITLTNCRIKRKRGRNESTYEILMNSHSKIEMNEKKFKIDDNLKSLPNNGEQLKDLNCMNRIVPNVGNRVSIKGNIVSMKDAEKITTKLGLELMKRECIISDSPSKAFRLVLWEQYNQMILPGKSYQLSNITIKMYQGTKYFSTTQDTTLSEIDSIDDGICQSIDEGLKSYIGSIVGIVSFNKFHSCVSCKCKVIELNKDIGECSKCGIKQILEKCKLNCSAKVIIEDKNKLQKSVSIFGNVIETLLEVTGVSDGEDDIESLLRLPIMDFQINSQNILVSFNNVDQQLL